MKLVLAITDDEDSADLIEALNENAFRVTKLATTGGFLKSGNTTLMIGVEEEKVDEVIDIIRKLCKKRKEVVVPSANINTGSDMMMQYPLKVEAETGGATIFVVDVDKFVRV